MTQLTTQQQKAITALVSGTSPGDVARDLGVNRSTMWRWQRDAAFISALVEARREQRTEVIGQLHAQAATAARVLVEVMSNPIVRADTRVRAAVAVLERVLGQSEIDELQEVIAALEQRLGAIENEQAHN